MARKAEPRLNRSLLLARSPLFASLASAELDSLAEQLPFRREVAGAVIMTEGAPGGEVVFLLDGEVEVIKAYGQDGERRLGTRGPGAVFGEMSLFDPDGLRTASVIARTPLLVCALSRDAFEGFLLAHPRASLEMLRILSRRLQTSENETVLDLTEKNRQLAQALAGLQAAQAQIVDKEKLEHELDLACQIQSSVLPQELPTLAGVELGALMQPARAVGGDFYGLWPLDEDRLALVVGDVSDKGMPAALGMALSYSLIRAEGSHIHCDRVERGFEPAEILTRVNRQLLEMGVMDLFVTVLFGIYESQTGLFQYARAGHPIPLLLDGAGRSFPIPHEPGQPLGLFEDSLVDYQTLAVPEGGVMLFYSDGVTEAFDAQGEQYGQARLEAALQTSRQATAQAICHSVWETVQAYSASQPNQDDVTLVCLKRVG